MDACCGGGRWRAGELFSALAGDLPRGYAAVLGREFGWLWLERSAKLLVERGNARWMSSEDVGGSARVCRPQTRSPGLTGARDARSPTELGSAAPGRPLEGVRSLDAGSISIFQLPPASCSCSEGQLGRRRAARIVAGRDENKIAVAMGGALHRNTIASATARLSLKV